MKYATYLHKNVQVLELNIGELDIKTITKTPPYPIVPRNSNSLVLKLDKIKIVDPTGLSWLLNLVKKYNSLGFKVSTTENSVVTDAIKYLNIEELLPVCSLYTLQEVI